MAKLAHLKYFLYTCCDLAWLERKPGKTCKGDNLLQQETIYFGVNYPCMGTTHFRGLFTLWQNNVLYPNFPHMPTRHTERTYSLTSPLHKKEECGHTATGELLACCQGNERCGYWKWYVLQNGGWCLRDYALPKPFLTIGQIAAACSCQWFVDLCSSDVTLVFWLANS